MVIESDAGFKKNITIDNLRRTLPELTITEIRSKMFIGIIYRHVPKVPDSMSKAAIPEHIINCEVRRHSITTCFIICIIKK